MSSNDWRKCYKQVEQLGSGGNGRVLKVKDISEQKEYALKILHPKTTSVRKTRFLNEKYTEEGMNASPMATNINPQEPMMQSFSSMPEVNTTPAPFTAPASAPTPTMNNIQLDNAISEVRMAVKNLENRGVIVKLVENDLGASYQIIVEIQK